MKTCRTCGLKKYPREFYRSGAGSVMPDCKDCCRAARRAKWGVARQVDDELMYKPAPPDIDWIAAAFLSLPRFVANDPSDVLALQGSGDRRQ